MHGFWRASIVAAAVALAAAGPARAQTNGEGWDFDQLTKPTTTTDLGYLLFANEYIKAANCEYDTEIPLAGIAQLFSNNGCFFGSVDIGGAVPTNKPELKTFGQNLDLKGGVSISGGPGVFIPLPAGPNLGGLGLLAGVDAFFSELNAKQITNQVGGGVLPVSGHYRSYGVLPYAGLGYLTRSNWLISVDAGAGLARNSIELARNGPLVEGSETGLVWRVRWRTLAPLTPNVMAGLTLGYSGTSDVSARLLPTGALFEMGGRREMTAGIVIILTSRILDPPIRTDR